MLKSLGEILALFFLAQWKIHTNLNYANLSQFKYFKIEELVSSYIQSWVR